eukprot:TRINITY_DN8419_c0_g1_i6.p2 TRINITY_DN8419_c0_g1~~TRINITY_DN8419_c0_g1_i6.p2  ORF type:complete len:186 (-),score=18.69 TRINITY_DN8419_c0_g1_i6:214-771(-)
MSKSEGILLFFMVISFLVNLTITANIHNCSEQQEKSLRTESLKAESGDDCVIVDAPEVEDTNQTSTEAELDDTNQTSNQTSTEIELDDTMQTSQEIELDDDSQSELLSQSAIADFDPLISIGFGAIPSIVNADFAPDKCGAITSGCGFFDKVQKFVFKSGKCEVNLVCNFAGFGSRKECESSCMS